MIEPNRVLNRPINSLTDHSLVTITTFATSSLIHFVGELYDRLDLVLRIP